jgi:hypothetical protein
MEIMNWVCLVAVAAIAAVLAGGWFALRGRAAPRADKARRPVVLRDGPTTLGGATGFARLSTIR